MWYGIAIIACSMKLGWVTIYSAIFINLMLRYVSGVPFPEEKYKDNAEWQQYCKETAVFVPWCANLDEG